MTRMQQRGYTAAGWDPTVVLLAREVGYETDTGKWKIGDGTTAWSALPYPTAFVQIDTDGVPYIAI